MLESLVMGFILVTGVLTVLGLLFYLITPLMSDNPKEDAMGCGCFIFIVLAVALFLYFT